VDDMNVSTIFESRDDTFFEDIFPTRDMPSISSWESNPVDESEICMEYGEESDDESLDSDDDVMHVKFLHELFSLLHHIPLHLIVCGSPGYVFHRIRKLSKQSPLFWF
jgi:hypothetical protein